MSVSTARQTRQIDARELLEIVVETKSTDLHIRAGAPPKLRTNGELVNINEIPMTPEDTEFFLRSITDEAQWHMFTSEKELDFAYSLRKECRFRVNAYWHLGTIALAFRLNRADMLDFEKLGLPPVCRDLAHQHRGLVLVTGITGSGKSTTLATMLDYINHVRACHIITIEDPIEFVYTDAKSLISQREVGYDTNSFVRALRAALREDPDVILVGEMRDVETIRTAVNAAETGHLVFSTLHTTKAATSVERILGFFSPTEQPVIRALLAENLKGVISQRLLPKKDGKGLVPALEIMVGTGTVKKLIAENQLRTLNQAIQNREGGMQTFNQALLDLMRADKLEESVAMAASDNPGALRRLMLGGESGGDSTSILG
jgi:twitching motility protein PilT